MQHRLMCKFTFHAGLMCKMVYPHYPVVLCNQRFPTGRTSASTFLSCFYIINMNQATILGNSISKHFMLLLLLHHNPKST